MSTSLGGASGYGNRNQSGLKGTGYKSAQLQQFSPEQMQLFQSLFSGLGSNSQLSKLAQGDQSQFEALEAPAMKQFGQLQGQLASRFSGQGLGARRGSGFQNSSNQATQDFAQQLQSQRLGLQRQALSDLHGMSNSLLNQRSYENIVTPPELSYGQQLGLAGVQAFGHIAGSWLGNR